MIIPNWCRKAMVLPLAATLLTGFVAGCGHDRKEEAAERQGNETAEERAENNPGAANTSPTTNPNGVLGDAQITAKVKSALIADHAVEAHDIDVDTKSQAVVLKGHQKSQAAITTAVADAKKIEGVKSVTSQLTVKPGD